MRIAMLSPIAWRTPPRDYGPWEQVVSLLTEGLVKRGVDVTLFATGDSLTTATLHAVVARGYEEDRELDAKVMECLHIAHVFEHADEFDLIHNHFDFLPLAWSRFTTTPVVTTIHGFSSARILPVYRKYDEGCHYVSISNADRSPELNYVANAYHGIDQKAFTYRDKPGDYLLFFGRIHADKGASQAIEIALRSGRRLVMAGIIQDQEYFKEKIEPFVDGTSVTYVGSVGPSKRDKLLGGAYALLHPISFAEPFGLSVVEAMACGTPVIAFNKGSMPEVVADGRTGFLVNTVDEAVDAVARVPELERAACRKRVEDHFSVDRMVDKYLEIYLKVLERSQRESQRPWGFYRILEDSPGHKVKLIQVHPGKRLSLQRHRRRSEHWTVVEGKGLLTRGGEFRSVVPGSSVDIDRGMIHRIENLGTVPLVFIEVQRGDYLGEDDIERLEDDFGRIKPSAA
jgi:glycosyltransferase involved in cell wall biosynthesis/quercetin dioxygenase-like cupin family protein